MEATPNNLLFPFASNIRQSLQKSKAKHCNDNGASTTKSDVLLKENADRGRKEGTETNASTSEINRRSDVMNGDGLHDADIIAPTQNLTTECLV